MRSSSVLTALAAVSSAFAAPRPSDNDSKRPVVADDSSNAHSSSVDNAEAASIDAAVSNSSDDKDAPVAPRAPTQTNNDIANLLLLLEYIETALYAQGLATYSQEDFCEAGFDPGLYGNLQTIYGDQQAYVTFLQNAQGVNGVPQGVYTFPSNDPVSFVQLAALIEGAGVSTYIYATATFNDDLGGFFERKSKAVNVEVKDSEAEEASGNSFNEFALFAASALAIESQHNGYIRAVLGYPSFPKPFETPLGFNAAYSLASQVISTSPSTLKLPFVAYPKLTIAPTENIYIPGYSNLTYLNAYTNGINAGLITAGVPVYAVFYSGLNTYYVQTTLSPNGNDLNSSIPITPDAASAKFAGTTPPQGQVYVVLSTADGVNNQVEDSNIIAGVGVIEVQSAPMVKAMEKAKRERVRLC